MLRKLYYEIVTELLQNYYKVVTKLLQKFYVQAKAGTPLILAEYPSDPRLRGQAASCKLGCAACKLLLRARLKLDV